MSNQESQLDLLSLQHGNTADKATYCPLLRLILVIGLISLTTALHAEAPKPESESRFINSLLVDKEMPVLGIKWAADIFVDAPLNGQPEDTSVILRRAQLAFYRSWGTNWFAKLTADYNNLGKFEVNDNFLRYSGWETAVLKFGIFNPPFSLESVSKSAGLTFMERSLAVVSLSERRSGGVGVLKRTPNSILNAGLFFLSPKQADLTQPGQAFVLHYAHSPIKLILNDGVHVGASFSYRINVDPDKTQFRSHPEITTIDDFYVDTGTISGAEKVIRFGLEAHKQVGPISWQTEFITTTVKRSGVENVNFWGAYTYFSWFLTGESRNYDAGAGRFLTVLPKANLGRGGKGAFVLAARISYVDLTDEDIIGGQQSNISMGLNWYLNPSVRLMTNLIKVLDVKRPGSAFDGEDPLIFSLRLQWQML